MTRSPFSIGTVRELCLAIVVFFSATTLQAEAPEAHELHIAPGTERAPLSLGSWLLVDEPFQVEVLSPPQFGNFHDGSFFPADEFWLAGGDQMTLRLTSQGVVEKDYTLYFTPLRAGFLDNGTSEVGFEDVTEQLPPQWQTDSTGAVYDIASLIEEPQRVISGQYSLLYTVQNDGDTGSVGGTQPLELYQDGSPFIKGADAANGYGGTRLDPPPFQQGAAPDLPFVEGSADLVAYLSPYNPSTPRVFVQLRLVRGPNGERQYEMRAALGGALACEGCATPWRPVPHSEVIRFEVWSGSRVIGPDPVIQDSSWAVRFSLYPAHGEPSTAWIEEKVELGNFQFGVMNSVGLAGFSVSFDDLGLTHHLHPHDPRRHLASGFEDGTISTWESRGDVSTGGAEPISGKWSLTIRQADMGDGTDAVVIDSSPGAATELSAQLSFDVGDLDFVHGDQLELIRAGSSPDVAGGLHVSLLLRRGPSGFRLRARCRDDQQALHKTDWFSLNADIHRAAIHWRANSLEGPANGHIRLFVDGALVGESTGIDNDTKIIESLSFGAYKSLTSRPGTGSLLSHEAIQIDDVVSFY